MSNYDVSPNPQLVAYHGDLSDAQFEAERALLEHETRMRYLDVLRALGFSDPEGHHIPGDVEIEGQRQRNEANRGMGLAAQSATDDAQRGSTLFSGRRIYNTATRTQPFVTQLADLDVTIPRQLSDLYRQSQGILSGYGLQQNVLLSQAAQRAALRARGGAGSGGGDPGGNGYDFSDPANQAQMRSEQGWDTFDWNKVWTDHLKDQYNSNYDPMGRGRGLAEGGYTDGPTMAGEGATPEAVVPSFANNRFKAALIKMRRDGMDWDEVQRSPEWRAFLLSKTMELHHNQTGAAGHPMMAAPDTEPYSAPLVGPPAGHPMLAAPEGEPYQAPIPLPKRPLMEEAY